MRKMVRSTARKMTLTGLLVILGLALSATPVLATTSASQARTQRHHKRTATKGPALVNYFSLAAGAATYPDGKDNPNANARIASCDPASATGMIQTTLQEGGLGLPRSYYPNTSLAYRLYMIHLSAQTQIWVSGDAGKPYMVPSLCALQAYDPEGNNETTYKNLESVTFTFAAPSHSARSAQQFFNVAAPVKVTFYVSGDVNA
jgi:hypothetical protein